MKWWFRQQLYIQIFVGIILGVALGLILGPRVSVLKPVGDIFIRLLMMLIVPLTFFTLVSGLTKLEDLRSFRSLGGMIMLYYGTSSLIAATLGMFVALAIKPGKGAVGLLDQGAMVKVTDFNFLDQIVSWFPKNPIQAMSEGNMLQIIVFSIIVGISLLAMGEKSKGVVKLFSDGADLMIKITEFVMKTAPYGILALVANMVATLGTQMITEVARFILADYIVLIILLVVFYPPLIKFLGKLSPLRFYRNVAPAMLVAASTTSSGATLPVSMTVAEENLGVSEKVWGYTLPLGATVNMNGMSAVI